jgi:tRNA threonylcarbamoyladenosine biosynthesis protein TsaB
LKGKGTVILKVLAVDTSSSVAAVAVIDDTKLLGEYILNHKKTHSQKLMPVIRELLSSLELLPQDIDIYAASSGPGSFTGLRIGVTSIKAMAYAVKKPVVSVPTLDALAYNIPIRDSLICPIMDARNNQVYTAVYKREKEIPVKITEYMGIPVADLAEIIKGKNRNCLFTGDAVLLHKDFLKEQLKENCEFAPANLQLQRASSVAQLALLNALSGKLESPYDMVPFYLRKSQAEREYEKKQGCCQCSSKDDRF